MSTERSNLVARATLPALVALVCLAHWSCRPAEASVASQEASVPPVEQVREQPSLPSDTRHRPDGPFAQAAAVSAQDAEARIPVAALAQVPASADLIVMIDVDAIFGAVMELLGQDATLAPSDLSGLLVSLAASNPQVPAELAGALRWESVTELVVAFDIDTDSALAVLPAAAFGGEARTIEEVRFAARGAWAYVGSDAAVEDALSDAPRLDVESAWAQGWGAIPRTSALALMVVNAPASTDDMFRNLSELGTSRVDHIGLGVPLTGSPVVVLDSEPGDLASRVLGFAQQASAEIAREARDDLPPAFAYLADYLELAMRGLFAQVEYERDGTFERVGFVDAPCGSDVLVPLAVAFLAGAGAELPGSTDALLSPSSQATTTACGPFPGPAARLPHSQIALLPPVSTESMVLALDAGATLRAALPRFFGILPFALPLDDVEVALGPAPFGLEEGLGSEAHLLAYAAPGDMTSVYVSAWPGVRSLLPPDVLAMAEQNPLFTAIEHPEFGYVVHGQQHVGTLERGPAASPSAWSSVANALPEQSVVGLFVSDGEAMRGARSAAREEFGEGGILDLVNAIEVMGIGVPAEATLPTVAMRVNGDAGALAESAQQQFEDALGEQQDLLREEVSPYLPAEWVDAYFAAAPSIQIEASGEDIVMLQFEADAAARAAGVIGALSAMAVPSFLRYIDRSRTTEATMNVRRIFDASVIYFDTEGQFPPSMPLTPDDDAQALACESGERLLAPSAWSEPGWQAMNFAVQDPHYYRYQYNSVGVGDLASFTASAFGDLDCDGVFSTFVRFGFVEQGEVVGSAGLYISNELE